MTPILLINPNSSSATTRMMVDIASQCSPALLQVHGETAQNGPSMIVNEDELQAAAAEVEQCWRSAGPAWAGVIVSAFGDPGLERLRALCPLPVVGIAEASMLEAGANGRRFGVATVTPELAAAIARRAEAVGMAQQYTGIRLTEGDPRALSANPQLLEQALAEAVQRCISEDGAEAVIIGGGPLGQAAIALKHRFSVPIIAPIPAAVNRLLALLGQASTEPQPLRA